MLSRQIHATEFVLALELREAGAEEIGYSILKLLRKQNYQNQSLQRWEMQQR